MTTTIREPHVVEAGRGASWWGDGIRLFFARIGTWIGIMIVYYIILALISSIPYVGSVGQWLLTPVFMGGIMLGCASIERDGTLKVSHLFEGFQGTHFVQLMIIGVVNIGLGLAIFALTALGIFGGMQLGSLASMSDPLAAISGSWRAMTGFGLLATLVVLVIVAVFAMLNWFAPTLVVLRGADAVQAMRLSFKSCLVNWVPFLVYGLIGMAVSAALGLALLAIAFMSGIGAIFGGSSSGVGAFIGAIVVIVILCVVAALIAGPIVFGSTYGAYKDTFAEDAPPDNPAYR